MLVRMVIRSLLNNSRLTAWTVATLATCSALVTLFTTATLEVGKKMSGALREVGSNAVLSPATGSMVSALRAQGVKTALLEGRVGLIEGNAVAVVAGESEALRQLTPYWAVTGRRAQTPGECLAGRRVADALKLQSGQPVRVEWPAGDSHATFTLVGLLDAGDEDDNRIFVTGPLGPSEFSYALLSVPGGGEQIRRLQSALPEARIRPLRQVLHGEEHVLTKINVLFAASLGAVLVLTALGVSASMLARVVERRKEFALLRAVGAKRRAVAAFLLAESAAVGVAAALIGFAVGAALAALVVRQIFQVGIGLHWGALTMALAITTIVALLAGTAACVRTLRFQPAAALRGE